MVLRRTFAILLLALVMLPLLPMSASSAERDVEVDVPAAHRLFDAVEPFLNEPSEAVKHAMAEHCLTLDRRCLAFAATHGEAVLSAVPDSPEFWALYDLLLAAAPLPVGAIEANDLPAYQGFIEGAKGWVYRELVIRGLTDADRLHAQVMAAATRAVRDI